MKNQGRLYPILGALVLFILVQGVDGAETVLSKGSAFLRFVQTGPNQGHVDTAVVSYHGPAHVTVSLVAALHIADSTYYQRLNRRFRGYDGVLYEMIKDESVPPEALKRSAHPISYLQRGMKNLLGLEFQLDAIDYTRPNFIHADMDPRTFARLQGQKGENLLSLLIQSFLQERQLQMQGKLESYSALDLIGALSSKDSAYTLKWLFAQQLDQIEAMLAGLNQGVDGKGSVIVQERNKTTMKVLDRQIRSGKRNMAIFFGAGHMPDFDRRLIKLGFQPGEKEWIVAWDVRPKGS